MTYSENENDYISETYNDEFDTKDEIINDLKKLSNKNDIKALRQYIIINRRKLKDYKTRLLNDVVNVKGYKFLRRDGKLIITKISPSSKYYKLQDKEGKSEYTPTNTDFESVASYADFEGFSEATPTLSKFRNDTIQAKQVINNFQPKQTINSIQPKEINDKPLNEPVNVDYMASANKDKTNPNKSSFITSRL